MSLTKCTLTLYNLMICGIFVKNICKDVPFSGSPSAKPEQVSGLQAVIPQHHDRAEERIFLQGNNQICKMKWREVTHMIFTHVHACLWIINIHVRYLLFRPVQRSAVSSSEKFAGANQWTLRTQRNLLSHHFYLFILYLLFFRRVTSPDCSNFSLRQISRFTTNWLSIFHARSLIRLNYTGVWPQDLRQSGHCGRGHFRQGDTHLETFLSLDIFISSVRSSRNANVCQFVFKTLQSLTSSLSRAKSESMFIRDYAHLIVHQ